MALKLVETAAQVRTYDDLADLSPDDDWIELPPLQIGWHQGSWIRFAHLPEGFCLTAGCLAGHVAIHDGYDMPVMSVRGTTVIGVKNAAGHELTFDGEDKGTVPWYARRALGLSPEQADELFAANNTVDDLRRIVERLCRE